MWGLVSAAAEPPPPSRGGGRHTPHCTLLVPRSGSLKLCDKADEIRDVPMDPMTIDKSRSTIVGYVVLACGSR